MMRQNVAWEILVLEVRRRRGIRLVLLQDIVVLTMSFGAVHFVRSGRNFSISHQCEANAPISPSPFPGKDMGYMAQLVSACNEMEICHSFAWPITCIHKKADDMLAFRSFYDASLAVRHC
jgi:hypothetical protein